MNRGHQALLTVAALCMAASVLIDHTHGLIVGCWLTLIAVHEDVHGSGGNHE